MAAKCAIFFFVDHFEQGGLVKFNRLFQICQQVLGRGVQHTQLKLGTGFRSHDQEMQATPACFQLLEVRLMHDFVQLFSDQRIDFRDLLIDRRDRVTGHIRARLNNRIYELPDQVLGISLLPLVPRQLPLDHNLFECVEFLGLVRHPNFPLSGPDISMPPYCGVKPSLRAYLPLESSRSFLTSFCLSAFPTISRNSASRSSLPSSLVRRSLNR